eukprot:GEMP01004925.1.p1 GENE.GEMP01004925.1~~GEMP01004925.1.p1  ORF type:complete len:1012 (+),score=188.24 GEMP01004925.1:171-3206(+)
MASLSVLVHALFLVRVLGQWSECPRSKCSNRGDCTVTYEDEFTCFCDEAWTGGTCLIPLPAACNDSSSFTDPNGAKCEDWNYENCPLAILLGNATEKSLPSLLSSCRKACAVPSCGEPYPDVFTDPSKRITWAKAKSAEVDFTAHGTVVVKTSEDPPETKMNFCDARFAYWAHAISPPVDKVEFRIGGTNKNSALALSTTNTMSVTPKPKDEKDATFSSSNAYGDYIVEVPVATHAWILRVIYGSETVETFDMGHGIHAILERFTDGSVALFFNGAHVLTFVEKVDPSRSLYAIAQPLTFHSSVSGIQLYGRKGGEGVQAMTLRPPLNKDCVGKFKGCDEQCENEFHVSSAASGTGAACAHEHKFIKKCMPGLDACLRVPCPDGDDKCHDHGKCEVDYRYTETFVCTCKDGWLGSRCDVPLSATCSDDTAYLTRTGMECDDFIYSNCDSATAYKGFTAAEENELFEKCPQACMVPPCLRTPTFRSHQKPESEVASVEWTLSEVDSLTIVHRGMTILRNKYSPTSTSSGEKLVLHYAVAKLPVKRFSARIGGLGNTKAAIALSRSQTLDAGAQSMVGDFIVGIDTLEDTTIPQTYLQIRYGRRTLWNSTLPSGVEVELRHNISTSKIDVLLNGKRLYVFEETVPADTSLYAIAQPLEKYSVVSSINVQPRSKLDSIDCVGEFGECKVVKKKCHKVFSVTTAEWGGGKQCGHDHKDLVPCAEGCATTTKRRGGLGLNDYLSIAAAVILGIVIIAYIICCVRRYKKRKEYDDEDEDEDEEEEDEEEYKLDEIGDNPLSGVPWTEEEKQGIMSPPSSECVPDAGDQEKKNLNAKVDEKLPPVVEGKKSGSDALDSNVRSSGAASDKDLPFAPDPNISPRAFLNKKDVDQPSPIKARVRGAASCALAFPSKTLSPEGRPRGPPNNQESPRAEVTSAAGEESPRRQKDDLQRQDSAMKGGKSKGKGKSDDMSSEVPHQGQAKGGKHESDGNTQPGRGGKDKGNNKGKGGYKGKKGAN